MASISAASSHTAGTLAAAESRMSMDKITNAAKSAQNGKAKNLEKIEATARDFEAVFITEMLKPMFAMVEVDPVFGGGKGEEVFRDFTVNEYGKQLSANGGIGIAQHIKAQLLRLQEESAAAK